MPEELLGLDIQAPLSLHVQITVMPHNKDVKLRRLENIFVCVGVLESQVMRQMFHKVE